MKQIFVNRSDFDAIWNRKTSLLSIDEFSARPVTCASRGHIEIGEQIELVELSALSTPSKLGKRSIIITILTASYGATRKCFGFDPSANVNIETREEHDAEPMRVEKPEPVPALPTALANRHGSVRDICEYFKYGHLPLELQAVVEPICSTIDILLEQIEDSSELTAGLRKLLEAKDCFVRAKLRKPKA
ncbi:MAG: hypothetical protein K2Y32_00415 [Candidatus Obscuribacterales bacterium]|nr:hypothetical protein [Candidatus Obscuribacterales bacterium]